MAGPQEKSYQVQEIMKCGKDPIYFIKKYVKIQHPIKGTVPFETYPFQDDVVRDFEKHRFNIIVKSRQLGISTVTAAYALWLALFRRDKNIVCIATKLATAVEFMDKVKVAFASLPKWLILKPKIKDSRQDIKFANGSHIRAIPRSDSAGRGLAASLVIIDEAAHIEGFETIWTALLPSLSTGGSAIMLSSPNGAAGLFYQTYVDAVAQKNDFNPIELKWDVHPERDEKWEEDARRMYSQRYFAQEYDCDFLGSGDTYISQDDIEWLKSISTAPIKRDGPAGQIWVWKEPIHAHNYIVSADVARGDVSGDYSAFHIIDCNEGEVVAEFMGHIRPDEFGKLLDAWGRKYNNALMAPEQNTYGHHTLTVLQHRDYPNLYYEQRERNPSFYPGPDDIPGYPNHGKKKRNDLIANMEGIFRNRLVRSYSSRLIHQIQTFIWKAGRTDDSEGKATAAKGTHDDLIISLAIGLKLLNVGNIDQTARDLAYAMLRASSRSSSTYVLPGTNPNMSSQYADAFKQLQSTHVPTVVDKHGAHPEAEADFGAHLPNHVKQRLGGLGWLF